MTNEEMIELARMKGFRIEETGKGKDRRFTAYHDESGRRLCPTTKLAATMRLVQVAWLALIAEANKEVGSVEFVQRMMRENQTNA